MNAKETLKILVMMRQCAVWNIFSQICFHEFIKYLHKHEEVAFKMPDAILHDGSKLDVVEFLNTLPNPIDTKRGANKFVTRCWLLEAFRLANDNNDIREELQRQSWYHFVRIITNAALHGGHFDFKMKTNEEKHLPVTFKKNTITVNDHGKMYSLSLQDAYELLEHIIICTKTVAEKS